MNKKYARSDKKTGSLFDYYGFTKKDEKECPVVSKILRELTPERIEQDIKRIQAVKLPPELQKWVEEYEKVGERGGYLWIWAYRSFQYITFPCVNKCNIERLRILKCLYVIYITMLDDVADKFKDRKLLNHMLRIPLSNKLEIRELNCREKKYYLYAMKLWKYIYSETRKLPRFNLYKEVYEFDLRQICRTMNYAFLVNKNCYFMNNEECYEYFSYNMPFIFFLTMDLMSSDEVEKREIGILREIAWYSQKIGQTVNWLTTWEREIKEKDYTSGVFSYAITRGDIKYEDLNINNSQELKVAIKKSNIEKVLLFRAMKSFMEIKMLEKKIHSINMHNFVLGLNKFILLQFVSRGNY